MYEYKILAADSLPSENNLNNLGAEGWRLIQVVVCRGQFLLYLIRERSN